MPHADTGDGGNPTYTVARALAAPQLSVRVPPSIPQSATTDKTPAVPSVSSAQPGIGSGAGGVRGVSQAAGAGMLRSAVSGAGKPVDVPAAVSSPGSLTLPRGEVLLIGGDLAYPNPTKCVKAYHLEVQLFLHLQHRPASWL
jgi:hypothetical protein